MLYVPNPFQQIGTYRGCSIEKHDAKECNLIENDVVHDIAQSIVNIFSRCSCSCAEAIKETQRSNYTYQVVPFQGYDQTEEPPYGYVWQRINNGFRYIGIELVGIGSVNLRIFPQFNNKLITWGYLQAGEEISGIMSRETNREVDPKCINILKILNANGRPFWVNTNSSVDSLADLPAMAQTIDERIAAIKNHTS